MPNDLDRESTALRPKVDEPEKEVDLTPKGSL